MQPLEKFSGRGADYARSRPSYPDAAIDAILKRLGDPSQLTAADVGAGTGIASRLLAERGMRVIAIEPNPSMTQAADSHPLLEFRRATAERTSLPDASVDLVTCFQAFHWLDAAPTLYEFHRILRPSGRVALVWNRWTRDQFLEQYRALIRATGAGHCPAKQDARRSNAGGKPLLSSPHFARVRRRTFMNARTLNLSGLIAYAQSKSFVPREGRAHRQLIADLEALHARWADERGRVILTYRTVVYLAEPRVRSPLHAVRRTIRRALSLSSKRVFG